MPFVDEHRTVLAKRHLRAGQRRAEPSDQFLRILVAVARGGGHGAVVLRELISAPRVEGADVNVLAHIARLDH